MRYISSSRFPNTSAIHSNSKVLILRALRPEAQGKLRREAMALSFERSREAIGSRLQYTRELHSNSKTFILRPNTSAIHSNSKVLILRPNPHKLHSNSKVLILRASASASRSISIINNMKQWKWYVYIIECLDKTYYTGMTWSISIRMEQHGSGIGSQYTQKHGFKRLAYFEEYEEIEDARKREIQLKNWSQEKKKKLITGEWKMK